MYKILVVDDEIKKIKNFKEEYIDNATINNLELKLNQLQYDFIYLDNSLVNEKIIYTLLYDYRVLPNIFEKLLINKSKYKVFINENIINRLIINNVGIIEYENEYEEFVIASIIEEKILKDMEIKSIYKRICPDKKHILDVKKIVKNVIARHYAEDSFYRKFKYILKHRVIQEKFSSKLLRNIEIERKTALDYILNKCKDFYIEELTTSLVF